MMQDGRDGEPRVARGELVPVEEPGSMREWAELLVARAREEGVALTGEGGLLTELMGHVLQTGLEVEMAEHLGYERGALRPPPSCDRARLRRVARWRARVLSMGRIRRILIMDANEAMDAVGVRYLALFRRHPVRMHLVAVGVIAGVLVLV